MKKIFLILFLILSLFLAGCMQEPFTNDVLYNCKEGDYLFSENHFLESVEIYLQEWDEIQEDKCILYISYKEPVQLDKFYEMPIDECKVTLGQLDYFKQKQADIVTILKDADCMHNTNLHLDEVIARPLDFKGKVRDIIGKFTETSTEFTISFQEFSEGMIAGEEFLESIKTSKVFASNVFKNLKDLETTSEKELEVQTKAMNSIEHYIDSLNTIEDFVNEPTEEAIDIFSEQMDKATNEMGELAGLLDEL